MKKKKMKERIFFPGKESINADRVMKCEGIVFTWTSLAPRLTLVAMTHPEPCDTHKHQNRSTPLALITGLTHSNTKNGKKQRRLPLLIFFLQKIKTHQSSKYERLNRYMTKRGTNVQQMYTFYKARNGQEDNYFEKNPGENL